MDYSHKQRRHSRTSLDNYLKLAIEIYPLRNCPNPHCVDVLTLWPMVIGLTLSIPYYVRPIQITSRPPHWCIVSGFSLWKLTRPNYFNYASKGFISFSPFCGRDPVSFITILFFYNKLGLIIDNIIIFYHN
jgi:hypothetical protein